MIEHTPNLTTQSTWIRSSLRQPPRNRPTFENQDQNPKPYFSHSLHLEPQKRHAKAIKLFKNETPEKNKEREEKSNSKEGSKPPSPNQQLQKLQIYRSRDSRENPIWVSWISSKAHSSKFLS